ncbi:hypothetical protein PIIN_06248 [Serendipita indica DSM 11827]|uniref:Uncharacterized protein n=1 Tax=Serendipita indica (strain DSM 11827) TaxID=1109443 RepID=G4TLX1_SERID|nr:hypothetical protein PIIN_06248 [Serendipita indica DSM 11827]
MISGRLEALIRREVQVPFRLETNKIAIDTETGQEKVEFFIVFYLQILSSHPEIPVDFGLSYNHTAFARLREAFDTRLAEYTLSCSWMAPQTRLPLPRQLEVGYTSDVSEQSTINDSRWTSTPPEILDTIFSLLRDVADSDMFPPWWISSDSAWNRLRRLSRLTLVCRAWYASAVRVLLRIVAIYITRENVASLEKMLLTPVATENGPSRLALSGFRLLGRNYLLESPMLMSLYHLRLHNCRFPAGCLQRLTQSQTLRSLSISSSDFDGKDLYDLVKNSPSLELHGTFGNVSLIRPPYPPKYASEARVRFGDPEIQEAIRLLSSTVTVRRGRSFPSFPASIDTPEWAIFP